MIQSSDLLLGILLVSIGLILWVSIHFVVRELKPKEINQSNLPNFLPSDLVNSNNDAMIIVEAGGKLQTVNDQALKLFELKKNQLLSLENLAIKVTPRESFFQICIGPGEIEFSINNQFVKATNYAIGNNSFVIIKPITESKVKVIDLEDANFYKALANLSQSISSSLDLKQTIQSILKNIRRIIPADFIEINIWEDDGTQLIPYQIDKNALENDEIKIGEKQKIGDGYTGLIIQENQPIWLENLENHPNNMKNPNSGKLIYKSMMGFPLICGHEVLGTLELFKHEKSGFTIKQFEAIENICGHIATSLNNAILYKVENQKAIELGSLAQLAQSVTYSREPEKIFEKMLATITPMIPVEILGFVLFNNSTNMLEAQTPFIGLPAPFIEIFKTEIKKNSNAEKLIFSQDVLMTENAQVDLHWIILGLDHIARAASICETVLIPLISGGVSFGFIMASNHKKKDATFSQAEMHLLMIVANQAAPIIENLILILQSTQKAHSAETLRRIALFSSSNASMESILKFSLKELTILFQGDVGALFLLNKESPGLQLDQNSFFGENSLMDNPNELLSSNDNQFPFTITGSQKPVVIGEFNATEPIIPYYQKYFDAWNLQSLLIVPLLVRDEGIGEIWIGSKKPYRFDAGDIQTLIPAASQLASVIEHQNLSLQTDDSLRKKVEQLSTENKSHRDLTSTLDLEALLKLILNESKTIANSSFGSILVFDQIPAFNKPLEKLLVIGDYWTHEFSEIEINLIAQGRNQLFEKDQELKALNLDPEIKSMMIFSLLVKQKTKGSLYLFSKDSIGFNLDSFKDVLTYINNTSSAFENALNFFQQKQQISSLHKKLEVQQRIFSLNQFISTRDQFEKFSRKLFIEVIEGFPVNCLCIYRFDSSDHMYKRFATEGEGSDAFFDIFDEKISWENLELFLNPDQLINGFYLIPRLLISENSSEDVNTNAATSEFFLYPLILNSGESGGFVALEMKNFDARDKNSSEILELFLMHVNPLLENESYLLSSEESRNDLVTSNIHVDSKTNAFEKLSVLQSIPDRLNILDNEDQIRNLMGERDFEKALVLLSKIIGSAFLFPSIIIFHQNQNEAPGVIETIECDIDQVRIGSLLGQINPIDFITKTRKILHVFDINQDLDWNQSPFVKELKAQSFLGIPIKNKENDFYVIFVYSKQRSDQLSEETLASLTKKIEIIRFILQKQEIYNIEKEKLQRNRTQLEFIKSINDLDQNQIMESLLARSLKIASAAQSGWIGIWNDADQKIDPKYAIGYKNQKALLEINFSTSNWSIPQIVFENKAPLSINELNFASNYPLDAKDLILYQQATGGLLPIGNLLIPIAYLGNSLGILVLENFDHSAQFDKQDEANIISTIEVVMPYYENALKFQETKQKANMLTRKQDHSNFLEKTNASIFSATNLNISIQNALSHLMGGLEAEFGVIYLENVNTFVEVEKNLDSIQHLITTDIQGKIKEISDNLIFDQYITVIDETYNNEQWINKIGKELPFASLIFSPLINYGEKLGLILFAHSEPFSFNNYHKEILESILPSLNFVGSNVNLSNKFYEKSDQLVKVTLEKETLESQSKAVLDSFADAVILTDSSGKIKFINRSTEKILDFQISEFENLSINELVAQTNSGLESWKNTILAWSNSPIILNLDQSFSSKINITPQRLLSLFSAPIIWNSEFLGTVSVFRDITLEDQVDRIKTEFIANVSHELRTPLTSIKGYADILLMGAAGQIPEDQRRFVDIINNNAIRLTTLVDNLLDISNIETGKIDLYSKAIYIDTLISQVVKEFEIIAKSEKKETIFDIRIPKNIHPVRGDENRIAQIMRILLNNSYHYSTAPVNISIRVSQTANETQIEIRDNGIGIKKKFQKQIFERFFRGEEELVLSNAGTGLGLAVAKSLVEMLGGQIWFFSSGIEGEGSVFSFTLPVFFEGS